jgi:hypothetical protein
MLTKKGAEEPTIAIVRELKKDNGKSKKPAVRKQRVRDEWDGPEERFTLQQRLDMRLADMRSDPTRRMVLDETVASVSSEVPKQLLNDAKRQTSSA